MMSNQTPSTRTCFMVNAHNQQNKKRDFRALGKLIQLKIQQKQNIILAKSVKPTSDQVRKKLRDSLVINSQELPNNITSYGKLVYSYRVNDKIITCSEPKSNNTQVEKCQKNKEIFLSIKNQIINKIKSRRGNSENRKLRIVKSHNKQNSWAEGKRELVIKSPSPHTCRYADISVSDFMEKEESTLGPHLVKRFYQFRNQTGRNRPRAHTE